MTGFIVGVMLGSVMGAIVFGLLHNSIDAGCNDREARRVRTLHRQAVDEYMAREDVSGRRRE